MSIFVRQITRPIQIPPESQPDRVNARALLSLRDFAERHKIARGSLQTIIQTGRIIPVLVGPDGSYYFINIEQYDNYQFGRWPKNRPQLSDAAPALTGPVEMVTPKRLISPAEFSRLRGVPRSTVTDYMDDGRIEATLLGPQGQYQFIDLDRYETTPIGRK